MTGATGGVMFGAAIEATIILLLILANGIFAMSEIAVVSARKVRLQRRAADGDARARAALELAESPTRFLSTVQIGITSVGILAGAFGGATLARTLSELFGRWPPVARYGEPLGIISVVLAITFLTLVLGELVPKRLALASPERIAAAVARPMDVASVVASPLVRLLGRSTDLVIRLLRVRPSEDPPITEEEVSVLIAQGTQAGVFDVAEQHLVERVFRLGDATAGALMTPRERVVWLDLEDPIERSRQKVLAHAHTRFVVSRGGLDDVVGVVSVKDLVEQAMTIGRFDVESLVFTPHYVPESMPAFRILERFKVSGVHIALVVGDHGRIEGLVTLNDVLDEIVGDIPAFDLLREPSAVRRKDGSWLVDGLLPIHELKTLVTLERLPGEETGAYRTVGGFVQMRIGHIPRAADGFDWQGVYFEVVDMDGARVDKVLVVPPESAAMRR